MNSASRSNSPAEIVASTVPNSARVGGAALVVVHVITPCEVAEHSDAVGLRRRRIVADAERRQHDLVGAGVEERLDLRGQPVLVAVEHRRVDHLVVPLRVRSPRCRPRRRSPGRTACAGTPRDRARPWRAPRRDRCVSAHGSSAMSGGAARSAAAAPVATFGAIDRRAGSPPGTASTARRRRDRPRGAPSARAARRASPAAAARRPRRGTPFTGSARPRARPRPSASSALHDRRGTRAGG